MGDFVIDDLLGQTARHGKRWLVFGLVMLVGLVGFGLPGSDRRPMMCAVCRLNRVDSSCLWIESSVELPTECSDWYSANVEPAHVHSWVRKGRCRRMGFAGLGGFACFMGDPITHLPESLQIEIYQQFEDRIEAKALFLSTGQDRADAYAKMSALQLWAKADYPGTWDDWWEKHQGDAH